MTYKLVDDAGIWVVAPAGEQTGFGFYRDAKLAQQEANRRNHQEGGAHADGTLKAEISAMDEERWRRTHLTRCDCTCPKPKQAVQR